MDGSDKRVSVGLTLKGWEWYRRDKQAHEELAQIRAEGLRPMTDHERQQWRAREFNAERKIEEIQAELQSDDDVQH